MHRLYPKTITGEGWFGREAAENLIQDFFEMKKRKTIITVQHTESLHHINGMIGSWYDWELTENGKKQAYEIGKWLLYEDCSRGFEMYVSDRKRALQTAEEMNKTLAIPCKVTNILREVNAGIGNGRSHDWYNANKKSIGNNYDPDYKPFNDAESDRDSWERLYPFYHEIISSNTERLIIVSHGTALSFLHSMFMGYSFVNIPNTRFIGCSGAVSKFVVESNGKVVANYINQRVC